MKFLALTRSAWLGIALGCLIWCGSGCGVVASVAVGGDDGGTGVGSPANPAAPPSSTQTGGDPAATPATPGTGEGTTAPTQPDPQNPGTSSPPVEPDYTRPGGFTSKEIVWRDEFDGTGLPSETEWNIIQWDPGTVNNEAQKYAKRTENLNQVNGALDLVARNDNWSGYKITSGRIESKKRWAPDPAGASSFRIEIRAKLAGGGGSWPAFWMLGNEQGPYGVWPGCGEIDIFEYVGNSRYFQCATHDRSTINHTRGTTNPSNPETEWHIYALNFYSDRMEFYVDDLKFHQWDRPGGWDQNSWPYQNRDGNGFSVILNVAVGGMMGGNIDYGSFPMNMAVDFVRVYEKKR